MYDFKLNVQVLCSWTDAPFLETGAEPEDYFVPIHVIEFGYSRP